MTTRRTITMIAATVLSLGGLAACGGAAGGGGAEVASLGTEPASGEGTDATTDDTTDSTTPTDPEEAMLAYTQCMRDHGVEMPDPTPAGGGGGMIALEADPDDPTFKDAQNACEPIMDNAVRPVEMDPEEEAEMREQLLAFSQCIRDHGIDMPDPVFGENGRATLNLDDEEDSARRPDPGDEDFQTASAECSQDGGPFVASASGPSGGTSDDGPTVRMSPASPVDDGEGG